MHSERNEVKFFDYKDSSIWLMQGDCLDRMKELEDNSVDSIVTDPPYGLSFMNKKWDHQVPSVEIWKECLRVLKPGGYLLSFAGTRTQYRMACNIEDAGFEIRDMIAWIYAQGIPKHQSCLKPALEPITLARKPAKKATLLNIDDCRVEGRERTDYGLKNSTRSQGNCFGTPTSSADFDSSKGRYPSNVITDGSDEVFGMFPDSKGAGGSLPQVKITGYGNGIGTGKSEYLAGERIPFNSGSGSAARFFKECKESKMDYRIIPAPFKFCAKASKKDRGEGNNHSTVKPTELMRYLCRLITPKDGIVLDPFMGSGSTGKAAALEGFNFIGVEMENAYFNIAKERILNAINAKTTNSP